MKDDYSVDVGGTCDPGIFGALGVGGEDAVVDFVPEVDGQYTVTLIPDAPFSFVAMYVVSDCGDVLNSCISLISNPFGDQILPLDVKAGETYHVIVDTSLAGFGAAFTVTFDTPCVPQCEGKACGDNACGGVCGTCGAGELCTAAFACEAALEICEPAVQIGCGDTVKDILVGGEGSSYAYGTYPCAEAGADYSGSPEYTLELVADIDGLTKVTLSSAELHVVGIDGEFDGSCEPSEGSCLAAGAGGATFETVAGGTYYLILDQPGGPPTAPVDVTVSCFSELEATDSCADAGDVGELPLAALSDLTGLADDFTGEGCGQGMLNGTGNADAAFFLSAAETGDYSILLNYQLAGPSLVYVYTFGECGAPAGCIAGKSFFPSATIAGPLVVGLTAGEDYVIVVDAASPDEVGPFELSITPPQP